LDRNREFPFDPKSLDAVILSHAHIDHSGNLPQLHKLGFRGNIVSTFATRDLCQLILADSAKVQAAEIAFLNKKRSKKNLPPVEPLYNAKEAEKCLRQFVTIDYGRNFSVCDGVTLSFYDAGHILGSAQVCLDIRENGEKKRLLFSGDVGRYHNDILRDPAPIEYVDYMMMESTYGARDHDQDTNADNKLCDAVNHALERGGKILIPAFAVERTQQIVYSLHQLTLAKRIPKMPIFVDSPLAVNATEVFRLHPECFNEETYRFLFEQANPFGFENLTYIRDVSRSMELNELQKPCIIVSASGMCEAGRILHHLRNNIEDSRTLILFVGHCAENTLGAQIRSGQKQVNILGESFRVNAKIEAMDSFSGHADHRELIRYFKNISGPKKKVWLVHGEPSQSNPFAAEMKTLFPESEFFVPGYMDQAEC